MVEQRWAISMRCWDGSRAWRSTVTSGLEERMRVFCFAWRERAILLFFLPITEGEGGNCTEMRYLQGNSAEMQLICSIEQ